MLWCYITVKMDRIDIESSEIKAAELVEHDTEELVSVVCRFFGLKKIVLTVLVALTLLDRANVETCHLKHAAEQHNERNNNPPTVPLQTVEKDGFRAMIKTPDLRCLASPKYFRQTTNVIQTLKQADSGATFSRPLFYNNLKLPVVKVVFVSYNYFVTFLFKLLVCVYNKNSDSTEY